MLRRDRELAMRTALGAGRGRLVRQLLTESTLLASPAASSASSFAWSTIGMLTTFVGRFTSRTGEIEIDPGVLRVHARRVDRHRPALRDVSGAGGRVDLVSALKPGGKGPATPADRRRMQSALIVAQVAVSVVLLIGAGLLLHSFYRLQSVETGLQRPIA